jgi:hypothetical protein
MYFWRRRSCRCSVSFPQPYQNINLPRDICTGPLPILGPMTNSTSAAVAKHPDTLGSLSPRLLGQCSPGSPASFPRTDPMPALVCYLLAHLHMTFPSPLYWFSIWHTLPTFDFLYSWVSSTGDSVCSHLLTLVPRSRIFLPRR